jgi:integrin beta 3
MLDPVEFGKAMAAIVIDATMPLLKRIEQLESCHPIKGDKGDRGERGADAPEVTDEKIYAQVARYLSEHTPAAGEKGERGEKGEKGEKGDEGNHGRDADPMDVREVIRGMIESDDLLSLVELRVKEEVTRIPAPKGGEKGDRGERGEKGAEGTGVADLLIDRDGNLVATMTDGRMKSLGVVCGKDGKPGRDGKDGTDFSGFDVDYDGERTLTIRGNGGDLVKRLPIPMDRGYWREGRYEKADIVTEGGIAYIAQKDTKEKPSLSSADWRIFARKGRDGKDGRNGIDKTQPTKLKDCVDA